MVCRADPQRWLRHGELHPRLYRLTEQWRTSSSGKGLPIIGDDIKSQVGATITHRVLTHLFQQRGVHLDRTYQLNFGGNTDFLNMLERERLESKTDFQTQCGGKSARLPHLG